MRLKVPIEVAEKIIDEHASAEDVLRQCALVCHDWLPRSRVHLFRRVVIHEKAQMDSLRRTLQTSPDIGNLIRAVCVRSDVGKFTRWWPLVGGDNLVPMALAVLLPSLQLHSSLETLHLDDIAYYSHSTSTPGGRIYRGCLSQYRSVRTLYLQSFEFHSHTQMIPFLSALPHLRRLVLHDLDFRCVTTLGEHLPSPPHAKLKLIPLTSIEMVGTIPGCVFRALWEVTHPTLEHLAMDSAPKPRLEAGRTWDLIRYPRLQKLSITESLSQQGNYWDAVDFAATLLENPLPELRVLRFDIQTELPDCPMAFLPSKNARSARAFKAIDSFVISQEHSGHPLAPQIIFVLPKVRGHVARDWTVVIQDSFSPMVRMHALHIENAPGKSHYVDGHRKVVQQLSFSPDGRYIASVEGSDYPSVILWDVRSGAIKNYWGHSKRFSSPPSFAFSPNGQHIALYDFPKGTLEVHECNANTGSSKIWGVQQAYEGDATWPAPPHVIWTAKNTVVICHTRLAASSFAMHSYHAEDGMRPSVGGVELRPYASTTFRKPADEGRLLEISPSGQLFLYRQQGEKGIVVDRRILDKSLGKQKLRCPEASLDASASHRLWFLQFIGRSDQEIVTALCWTCRSVLSWELARAERARHPPARVEVAKGTIAGEVYDSSVVPILSQNGEVVAWRAPDPSPGQSCAIVACGTSPNRQLRSLQMPGMSASYIRWRPPLVLSPDGSLLADFQSKEVLLWRTRDGLRVASIQNHPSLITALAFSANGEVIATGAADGMVRIYHLKDIIANNCATAASGVAEDGGHASVDGEHASTVGSVKGKEDMGAL